MTASPISHLRVRLTPTRTLLLLAALFLWVACIELPGRAAGPQLDDSWSRCYGFFLTHRLRAGVDYIFTFGPLGYFYTIVYDADLFRLRYVWELALKLCLTVNLILLSRSFRTPLLRAGFLVTVALLLPLPTYALHSLAFPDAYFMLLLFSSGLILLEERAFLPAYRAVLLVALSLVALVKFTFLLYALGIVLLAELNVGAPRRSPLSSPVLLFLVFLLCGWLLAGQPLSSLPAYLRESLIIAIGYNQAMAIYGRKAEVLLAAALLVLYSSAALQTLRARRSRRDVSRFVLIAGSLFFVWKNAMVRQDGFHVVVFFIFTFLLALLLPTSLAPFPWRPSFRTLFVVAGLLMSLAGMLLNTQGLSAQRQMLPMMLTNFLGNTQDILTPFRLRRRLERESTALAAQWSLPRIKAQVQQASIDLITNQQGLLFLNHLHYHPRPVFQSYSAYTSSLLNSNARHFDGPQAPEYVLLQLVTIDNRLPAQEESQAMLQVYRHYFPVLAERSYLLLKRLPTPQVFLSPAGSVVYQRTVSWGEWIDLANLPGVYQTIRVDIHPTVWNLVWSALYKPPLVSIDLDVNAGQRLTYRLIPEMTEEPFLINPLIQTNRDVLNLYGDLNANRVQRLRIVAPGQHTLWFHDEITVTIRAVPEVVSKKLDRAAAGQPLFEMQ